VPAVLNMQVPLQPGPAGEVGSGGGVPPGVPALFVQDVGCAPMKSALCMLMPDGYEKSTVPPTGIAAWVEVLPEAYQ
jgi:hypothetical protein